MAKYIIDVKDGETLYKAVIAPDGEPYITPAMGNVYTEPDTDEAYQRGLADGKRIERENIFKTLEKFSDGNVDYDNLTLRDLRIIMGINKRLQKMKE